MNYMDNVTYGRLGGHNKEMIFTDYWDISCTRSPNVGYWPDFNIFRDRIKSVTGFKNPDIEIIETTVRNFPIYQPGQAKVERTDLTLSFVDFADKTLTTFAMNLKTNTANPLNREQAPFVNISSDWIFTRLDSQRRPIIKWVFTDAILISHEASYDFTEARELEDAELKMTFSGFLFPMQIQNIPVN